MPLQHIIVRTVRWKEWVETPLTPILSVAAFKILRAMEG